MSGEEAGRAARAGFAEFASAHEGLAVRSAVIVCGDARTGERVALEALTAVALGWAAAREEGPESALRHELHRRALAAVERRPQHGPATGPTPDDDTDVAADADADADVVEVRRAAVRRALVGLTPRQRSVAVLTWLEDRHPGDVALVLDRPLTEVHADLAVAQDALEGAALGAGGDDAHPWALLALVADEVDEPPVAVAAGEAADRRRRVRRRGALLGGAALVAGVAGAFALGGDPEAPAPRPRPTTSEGDGRLTRVDVAGIGVFLAPVDESRLPLYPDAPELALPQRLGPGTDRPLELLSAAGSSASVRAAFLVQVEDGRYQPALFLPRQTPSSLLVPMAPLRPTADTAGAAGVPLGPRTIDTDRHRLVFPQPGAVVVLEVRSARTFRFPVRDENLVTAGWAPDGHTVVATSSTGRWLVDTRRSTVVRAGGEVVPGWADIGVSGGRPMIRTFSGAGRLLSLRSLDGPEVDTYGEAISNIEGWACRATFFGASNATLGRMQGLIAAQSDTRPQPRILAAPNDAPLFAYRPLGWGPRDTVLLESRSTGPEGRVRRVLAWDVIEGRMYRVAEVDPPRRDPAAVQAFTGAWAL
ncbi:hypothetical protein [Arthrobacter sp. NEB 688]|uniref:hypothetical protein n=1 Tax=Arthrobacter sp. NEB 688 TaxID=904039 RepID=UPI0015647C58|nr:hypothetical protein [Arthrobacter sp. NEB 688]QKE85169.1 hypothetical protein HL663_15310 [Arthrobacter sp. NEB 688]